VAEKTRTRLPSAERREEIIAAAVKLWASRGYHATSVSDLCDATGIGKGALYHHIGSKEEILYEIHTRFADPILEFGKTVLASDATASEKLTRIGRGLLSLIHQYQDYVTIFYREVGSLSEELFQNVRVKRREFERVIDRIIEDGIASGEFRPLPVHLTTLAFLGMHNYSYAWYQPHGALSDEEIAKHFADIFLSGLVANRETLAATNGRDGAAAALDELTISPPAAR
jgi:AcrR family transcriptional regulator